MLYTLYCTDRNTKDRVSFLFDSKTSRSFKGNGEEIDFSFDSRFINQPRFQRHESAIVASSQSEIFKKNHLWPYRTTKFEPFSETNPLVGKSRQLAKLRIQLGFACNYRCQYCLQSRSSLEKVPKKEDVDFFMQNLIHSGITLEEGGVIDLWGGEPLLYWQTLVHLLPALRKCFGVDTKLSLFTNGVLLNKEKIDFLLGNRVQVEISHDGIGFSLRNLEDPFDNPRIKREWLYLWEKSRAKGIPMGFFSVITPLNCDLYENLQFFKNHFTEEAYFQFGGAASETENLPTNCLLSEENVRTLSSCFIKAIEDKGSCWHGINRRVFNLMGRIIHRIPVDSIQYHCSSVDSSVLNVNLKGDVISCQNRNAKDFKIGDIDKLQDVVNPHFRHWSTRKYCPDCLVLASCKGGCPDLSDEGFERCCQNEWAFQFAVFSAAWYLLTGTVIEEVSPKPNFRKQIPISTSLEGDEIC